MKNTRKLSVLIDMILALALFSAIAGCSTRTVIAEVSNEAQSAVQEEIITADELPSEAATIITFDEAAAEESIELKTSSDIIVENIDSKLPRYEYPGPEAFYTTLYDYLRDEYGQQYSNYDVCIPTPYIIEIDDSDNNDIKVYGDFWIHNYNLEGDTLMFTSGGSYPGCIHIKFGENGYEVTSMDLVGDGSNFEPTARMIFGDMYDDFIAITSDKDAREGTRAQVIANYVAANNLEITQYQDYGWDPVTLPEENIDTFYSQLD